MVALTKNQKIGIGIGVTLVVVGIIVAIVLSRSKNTAKPATATPSATTKPSGSATTTPSATTKPSGSATTTPSATTKPSADLREVYYSDKGGTDRAGNIPGTRYAFTFAEASAHATERGGVLATPQQLEEAHRNGLDVCWFGWASDGIYTVAQKTHGYGSGCEGDNLGAKKRTDLGNGAKAGAWVYGIKPSRANILNCKDSGVASSCVLPFSTITNKWSQYS